MALVLWIFQFRKISQNEFTEIDTLTGGGHVPARPIWSIGVFVSSERDMIRPKQCWTVVEFRVLNLNEICMERCDADLLQCILNCPENDTSFLSVCIREENECTHGEFFIKKILSMDFEIPL